VIAVYIEFDLKGNLFSSRNLMLQAIRLNQKNPSFYLEYFKYELAFSKKIVTRKLILRGDTATASEGKTDKEGGDKKKKTGFEDGDDFLQFDSDVEDYGAK
jgi:hypothetical protein